MRGVYTSVNDIRKMVFAEVARLAYDYQDGDLSDGADSVPDHPGRDLDLPGERVSGACDCRRTHASCDGAAVSGGIGACAGIGRCTGMCKAGEILSAAVD